MEMPRLTTAFFLRDVVEVAPDLVGKILVRCFDDGKVGRFIITETEAYRGKDDLACHAVKGMTPRTRVMFGVGGVVYVYFIYGMYWMLNFVTGREGDPNAVLIRGVGEWEGPGRVGRLLQLDHSFYGEELATSSRLWVENSEAQPHITAHPRVGIQYAGEPWVSMPWRFKMRPKP